MIDKYKELTIFELENGFVLKSVEPTRPQDTNQPFYTSKYCKDADSLTDEIKEILNKK